MYIYICTYVHMYVYMYTCMHIYMVGSMCPVFSSVHARVNACARTRHQGLSLLRNLSGKSPSFV